MPRSSSSGTTGLRKIHLKKCPKRGTRARPTACKCPWFGEHKRITVHLARWCGQTVDPKELGPARTVFLRVIAAIDAKTFDPAGEHKTRTSGTTFGEYIEEWWKDECEKQQKPVDTPLPPVLNVIATSKLGRTALHDLTTEPIETWLISERKTRKWGKKSYNEYRRIIIRFLDRAVTRRTITFNPARAIERMKGVTAHKGEFEHFRLDEGIEAKLFEVVRQLNRTQSSCNKNSKLTQEKADAIRAKAKAGTLQTALAKQYRVSLSVVNDIVHGKIWNPATHTTTTKGFEMERRLIGAYDMGPRRGEMQGLQIKHVDWAHPKKLVDEATGAKFNGYAIALPPELSKGGKWSGETEYLYAATLRASRMLEARRFQLQNKPDAYIFGTEKGHHVTSFDKSWQALFKLAGIPWGRGIGVVWHTYRHEFISRVAENRGVGAAKVAGRHKRLETSQRYIHPRRDAGWDAAFSLNRS